MVKLSKIKLSMAAVLLSIGAVHCVAATRASRIKNLLKKAPYNKAQFSIHFADLATGKTRDVSLNCTTSDHEYNTLEERMSDGGDGPDVIVENLERERWMKARIGESIADLSEREIVVVQETAGQIHRAWMAMLGVLDELR